MPVKQGFWANPQNKGMMTDARLRDLSCSAKLARVVLQNCGPLSPAEVAREAYLSPEQAEAGIRELEARGYAKPVCGVCKNREVVYALTEASNAAPGEHHG